MDAKLSQAIQLFNTGQKQEALTLFTEIVNGDPANSTAWYGIALCQSEREKTIDYLKKTISLDPNNEKAKHMLNRLVGSKNPDSTETASAIPPKQILPSPNIWLPYLLIVMLAVVVVWLFFRMDKQEKQLEIASSQIRTLDSQVQSANSQIR